MSLLLAIDQSTSATKAVLFDRRGRVLQRASRSHRQIYPQPGWVEHDAEEVWRNVLAVIREIAGRGRSNLSKLACISIANQRETVLAFDRRTGKPLYNALVWQDRRGAPLCARLVHAGHEKSVRARTGLKIDTYFSASKIQWLMESQPGIAAKLKHGHAVIGTMDAYLIHRLTNGKVFATDSTNASRTLLFNIGRLCWDETCCELFGVPMRALPEVRESASQFGETDAGGLLPAAVPIAGVMGDSQASLFAQRCFKPGTAKATFGTGTSVLLTVGHKPRVSGPGAVTALGWVWRNEPTYAFEGLVNCSGATIEWLKNQLGLIQGSDDVEVLAARVKDNGGVYLVPAFAGLGAPYWSAEARAAIVGMTAHTRKEHVVRAALEAIAYQVRDVLDMMCAGQRTKLKAIHADGGATRNQFLMQFTADVTRAEIRAADVAESSAWGAAMNGLLALGLCKSLEDLAKLPLKQRIFRPKMKVAEVRKLHDLWLAAVKRVL